METDTSEKEARQPSQAKATALKFVLLIGVMSLFADFTYEGSRSIIGPYLALLGASAAAVGIVTGLGELLGYGLRLVSGRGADRTGKYWPITIFGYIVQMSAVPLLALAGNWPVAALLIILERVGKAIRNPPRDVMLSHAAKEMGYGWAFGVHEALDQSGALLGPLAVAAVLALRGQYRIAFAVLLVPALVTLSILLVARLTYPRPEEMEANPPDVRTAGLPRVFWVYLAGAVLVAAGFADFPLIAYHFVRASSVPSTWIPVFYAVAMGVSGMGSLFFGRLLGRHHRPGPFDAPLGPVCAAGIPGRLLGGARRSGALGAGHGRPRVDHPGCCGPDGAARASCFGLWPLHCRIWRVLVPGQCGSRHSVRRVTAGADSVLPDRRTRRHPAVYPCETAVPSDGPGV